MGFWKEKITFLSSLIEVEVICKINKNLGDFTFWSKKLRNIVILRFVEYVPIKRGDC